MFTTYTLALRLFIAVSIFLLISTNYAVSQAADTSSIIRSNQEALYLIKTAPFKSLDIARKNLESSRKLKFSTGEAQSLKILAEAHYVLNQTKQSVKYYDLFTLLNDSLKDANNKRQLALLKARFDYEKRESALKADQDQKRSALEKEILQEQRSQFQLIIFLSSLVLILLVVVWFLLSFHKKNKALLQQQESLQALLHSQKAIIEEKTKAIISSKKAISDYSFLNSHELRAPLAKILSITYLFDEIKTQKEFLFDALKSSAKELEKAAEKIMEELPKAEK